MHPVSRAEGEDGLYFALPRLSRRDKRDALRLDDASLRRRHLLTEPLAGRRSAAPAVPTGNRRLADVPPRRRWYRLLTPQANPREKRAERGAGVDVRSARRCARRRGARRPRRACRTEL